MAHFVPSRPSRRKPILDRYFVFAVVLSVVAGGAESAVAQGSGALPAALTEQEALQRGLTLPAYTDILQRDVAAAQAALRDESLWPNPVLSYSREDAAGSVEDMAWLSQELLLSGRRGLSVEAADERLDAAEQRVQRAREQRAVQIRLAFYSVLLTQERVAATRGWAARLEDAVRAVARREQAGDVSAYDRRRVERERHNAESRVATENAARETAWARLAPLLGLAPQADEPWPTVAGVLLPEKEPPSLADLAARLESRGDLQAIENEVRAAELEGRAAGRGWIPSLTLGVGPKIVDADESRDTGFIVTASLPFPVFRREQPARIRAAGNARAARGDLALRLAEAKARLHETWRNATRLAEAARHFAAETEDASARLIQSAEAAYRGGEIGVLELVDAYRAGIDDRLRRLALEQEARRARIALDLVSGGGTRR